MGQRYILALVLMVVVMFAWSLLFGNKLSKQRIEKQEKQERVAERNPLATSPTTNGGAIDTSSQNEGTERTHPYRTKPGTTVHVQTDYYDITFSTESATAQRWILSKYPNRSGGEEDYEKIFGEEDLMNLIPATAQNCLSLQFFQRQLQDELDNGRVVWQVDKDKVDLRGGNSKEADSITFSTQVGENLKIYKKLIFYPNKYFVDLELTFQNLSDGPLETDGDNQSGYKLRWGPGINADLLPHERSGKGRGRTGGEGAKAYTGIGKPTTKFGETEARKTVKWAGLNSKYFAALMIPDPALEAEYLLDENLQDNGKEPLPYIAVPKVAANLVIPNLSLAANQSRTDYFSVYVGPKDASILKDIQLNTPNAPNAPEESIGLEKIIDFGFFSVIVRPMKWILNAFYSIFRNYGIAIILLTVLVKLVSYPLMRKSYKSMNRMKKLQPLLTELKEKYRDDPQKLNRATMRLYKEHGVNPLGGCIPWIPQIPILFALFTLLGTAVELRDAPFFLWIDDLSAPDELFHLPFTIPLIITQIDAIRILPFINGLTTFLQQKMMGGMTPAADNMQAKMMQFLPLIFVFVLYNWASGLILYWTCGNIFTIGQQYLLKLKDSDETEIIETSSAKTKRSQPKKRIPSNVKRK